MCELSVVFLDFCTHKSNSNVHFTSCTRHWKLKNKCEEIVAEVPFEKTLHCLAGQCIKKLHTLFLCYVLCWTLQLMGGAKAMFVSYVKMQESWQTDKPIFAGSVPFPGV